MEASEFDALTSDLTRLTSRNLEAARAVLVDGRPANDVAQECGMTKQRLGAVVRRIEIQRRAVPLGWKRLEIWLPVDAIEEVKKIEQRERAKFEK